jgi:calcineurin-like phosphoesterase
VRGARPCTVIWSVWWTRRTSTSWWPTSRTPPEGFGVTPAILEELDELPVNVWTTGNHVWDKKEGVPLLDAHPTLLRPANYPEGNPGRGLCVETTAAGIPVAVMNLQGQVMMPPIDNPFRVADRLLEQLREERRDVRVVLVDMHAEATSEKQGIALLSRRPGHRGAGNPYPRPHRRRARASQGNGAADGRRHDRSVREHHRDATGEDPRAVPDEHPAAVRAGETDVQLRGALVDADEMSGRAIAIRRVRIDVDQG